jgi:hypothetical protein
MPTPIEDIQRDGELQELHFLSSPWLSDLEFLETDLLFLKNLLGGTPSPLIVKEDFKKIANMLIIVALIKKAHVELKHQILSYQHKLKQLISNPGMLFDTSLINTHTELEQKLRGILLDFTSVKKIVLSLAKGD